jgi:hypothetical protein
LAFILCAAGVAVMPSRSKAQHVASAAQTPLEDIYIARSVRESHAAPTAYCSRERAGFAAENEDQFTFRSVAVRTSDGRVVDSNVQTVGAIHACFGPTANPAIMNFYGEGSLADTAFQGRGECRVVRPDFPERGLTPLRCFLDLSGLPAAYVGGELTTNTILSRQALGLATDPPGYTQASIATIRLWRSRAER